MSFNTFVIIPTYNESENIQMLIEEVLRLPVKIGVIVVDDNSPDGTGRLAEKMKTTHPGRVHVIHREGKLGLGTAYAAGIRLALDDLNAARIMTMDADFSHLPGYIPAMIGMSHERHIVIGSRYVPGGGTVNWPIWRKLLSWGANTFSRTMLGLDAHDTTAGFRLYHRQVLEQVPPESIQSSGYSFLVEMLFNCEKQGFVVGEVPILFEDRRRGESKVSSKEIIRAIGTVFRLFPKRFSQVAALPSTAIVDDGPQPESPSQND
jgi:dolichol-phosphate mannosyltransferase